ncbi:hypothetical protein T11_5044 [Trichinella zimbabwensis]|uniref:Uncharacterized protein n=1 Tax=Trichinella zimbabwensis TaxID=268475 RepID=A0A0V1GI91_9BILA|nr:hypothetical protein T11_5044 [Trichinella zimbabwensis]
MLLSISHYPTGASISVFLTTVRPSKCTSTNSSSSEPFDIAQLLFILNNGNESYAGK